MLFSLLLLFTLSFYFLLLTPLPQFSPTFHRTRAPVELGRYHAETSTVLSQPGAMFTACHHHRPEQHSITTNIAEHHVKQPKCHTPPTEMTTNQLIKSSTESSRPLSYHNNVERDIASHENDTSTTSIYYIAIQDPHRMIIV